MKHQLKYNMYCKIDENLGKIVQICYNLGIYVGGVYPFEKYLELDYKGDLGGIDMPDGGQQISSNEFLQRLKGEYT